MTTMAQRRAFVDLQNIVFEAFAGPGQSAMTRMCGLTLSDFAGTGYFNKNALYSILETSGLFHLTSVLRIRDILAQTPEAYVSKEKLDLFEAYAQAYTPEKVAERQNPGK
jgi:hypothetical protein